MKLSDLLNDIEVLDLCGSVDTEISGIMYDSRNVKKDSLFVCISGFGADRHDFIEDAIERGAAAVIVERDVPLDGVVKVRVKNARAVLPKLAAKFYSYPTKDMRLIGITGTNGKTTTTYLIKAILEADKKKAGLLGTISIKIGDKTLNSKSTTPESLDLQSLFREMANLKIDYAVMEVSSHSLELGRVDECRFQTGVFTNLTQDHLDFHKTLENYRNAKKKLFYYTHNANIINIDDEHGRVIAEEVDTLKTKLITYGIDRKADIMAKNLDISAKGAKFTLITPTYEMEIETKIPGKFSVYNALAAASAAYSEGIGKEAIKEGLRASGGVPGRSEVVDIEKPYTVIIDYAHTPDGLENILNSIRQYAKGRIISLFGCGGDRDSGKRAIMGEAAGKLSDFCIITSDNPRTENPMHIISQIEEGIKNTTCKYICLENRREAIAYALSIAEKDDIILLAGKGHETYQVLSDKTIPFDEREIVLELLSETV